ncbi:MAG: methyltransferase, partial [Actinomycetia bacterium]|nr:methyltransferase [Actinomycetes bacterium]
IPGTDIPIVSPAELILRRPDIVLILNYDMAPEVRRGLAELDDHGTRFFLPMPEPREMPDLS